jgi:hypothetical protein
MRDSEKLEKEDISAIIRTESGKRFLARLLDQSSFLKNVYMRDGRDHAYHEGRRSIGEWVYAELQKVDPELPLTILKELNNARSNRKRTSDE